jgi:DNA-binding transcriptional LysR family regulator
VRLFEAGSEAERTMEMQQVRYFLGVAEHLNFTRAADRLHVAQPSLTRAIQKLEDELGGPLFRRERANTHLTELGRMMLPHLQAALAAAEAAKKQAHSFRQRETGQLALGACSMVSAELGTPLLSAVLADMPGLDMRIEIASSTLLEELLVTGALDAAILVPMPGPHGAPGHERFDRHPIARNQFVVAFGPAHRFNAADELTLRASTGSLS